MKTFVDVLIVSYDQESLVGTQRSIGVDVSDQKLALLDGKDVDLMTPAQVLAALNADGQEEELQIGEEWLTGEIEKIAATGEIGKTGRISNTRDLSSAKGGDRDE